VRRFEAIHELELEPDALEAAASLPGADARTGKLVTSAALVLMFAFFVLSTSPGTDIKQFGIGLAAGIIFDATVIRALLVPAVRNWWLPDWSARALRTRPSEPVPEGRPVPESA
jgi:putative drug exporter of the RND superfamily